MRFWLTSALAALAIAVGVVVLVHFADALQHWISVHSGTVPVLCKGQPCTAQPYYNWWSGPGSDLGELTLITFILTPVIVAARHRNCATRGCWRLTSHTIKDDKGVEYRRCHKHHPSIPNEHSNHGLLRNHMSDEHLAAVDAQHLARLEEATTP